MNANLETLGSRAKTAAACLNKLSKKEIDAALERAADKLVERTEEVLAANAADVKRAEEKGVNAPLVDRLRLDKARIADIADGLRKIAALPSPVGETVYAYEKENGLKIEEKRVPFGVIGMIFESRPNVAADAFGLCFKTANAVILRGGSDAVSSVAAIVGALRCALKECGVDENAVQLIEDTSRETVTQFMKMRGTLDLLFPRGGAGLIRNVLENATVPVIETGTGNCHIYVDETADADMAANIVYNAKTQRYGVCNACESLVVHKNIAAKALPAIYARLKEKGVEVRADEFAQKICAEFKPAAEEDFGTEYLDAVISVKTVNSVDEAIAHINKYNTKHSESIITNDAANAEKFLNEVDAAAVYVNASTRFTDGFEFGLGAEIGISTQKLHARGPMGLRALTTTKFYCRGEGQIR
ncbi:MAG: glutamate-5-semialdehyde dehydrogenase [Bacillota bacterium]|nr:MAG: glutamate-5-semialdehyde dehydrogenase [Bacillota bacterium]